MSLCSTLKVLHTRVHQNTTTRGTRKIFSKDVLYIQVCTMYIIHKLLNYKLNIHPT